MNADVHGRLRLATAVALLVAVSAQAGSTRVDLPSWPQARERVSEAQGCVEPTEVMRKDHMRLLLQQRDLTVHRGIRTKRHSLVGCINCHVSTDAGGKFNAINAPGQFCQSCHAYAGVKMDCFDCHATTPARVSAAPGPRSMKAAALAQVSTGARATR